MANYNDHKCLTCGQIFDYCRRCVITPITYKAEGFCSEKCADIFNTLSKHECNLITTEEAFVELSTYDINEDALNESIVAHINKIKSEHNATIINKPEESVLVVEDKTIVKQHNKK